MSLTVDIENHGLGLWHGQVGVGRLADESCVQVLPADIGQRQSINGHPVGTRLRGVVQHGVFEEPDDAWSRPA